MTFYVARATGNLFLTSFMNSIYNFVMDFGFVVLPSWLLLWASASFRRQLLATFLPNVLYGRIFGTHTVTILKPRAAAIVPPAKLMQISSNRRINN
jgi:hypothetical protein